MTGCREIRLGDVAKFIDYRGKTPRKTETGIPLITAKIVKNGSILPPNEFIAESDYDAWMTRGLPKTGDVVLTTEAPLGEVAQLKDAHVALAQRIIVLRAKEDVLDNTFLKYFLLSSEGQARLKSRETGTTVAGIKSSELQEVLIPLPDLETQKQIAGILSSLDDKIEVNNQINRNLEEQAFSFFDDLIKNVSQESTLSSIAIINPLRSLKKGVVAQYIDMAQLSTTSAYPAPGVYKAYSGGMKFMNGDTLLARITPCLENGKTAYIDFLKDDEVAFGSTEYIVLSSRGEMPPQFFYCLARNKHFRNYAIKSMNGSSGRQRVSADVLADYPIPKISKESMKLFGQSVEPLFKLMRKNAEENIRLSTLRVTLLPKLMSGEINLP